MQQLTGMDAWFLAMESDTIHGHVGSVIRLDPSTATTPLTRDRLAEVIGSRLGLVPLMRRHVVDVPFRLAHPYWAQTEQVDLDHHIRELTLPAPGDDEQLLEAVARLHEVGMDTRRPLWEVHLINGLADGSVAVYSKVHHAAVDGVGGSDSLQAALLDLDPEGTRPPGPSPDTGGAPAEPDHPTAAGLLGAGALSLARQPVRAARLGAGLLLRSPLLAATAGRRLLRPDAILDRLPHRLTDQLTDQLTDRSALAEPGTPIPGLRAPGTPFNASISAERTVAAATLPLATIKKIKNEAGVTVNDVVMALSAGALRQWLIAHQALPRRPLVAAVPVSIRTDAQRDGSGNRVSCALAGLPTDQADPGLRLRAAAAAMRVAKKDWALLPATTVTDTMELMTPPVAALGWRLAGSLRVMERVNPFNLIVSNIPGPSVPLYYAGARMTGYWPVSGIAHGQGLNITVISYLDSITFGLVACPHLIPDLSDLAGFVVEEFERLQVWSDQPDRPRTR